MREIPTWPCDHFRPGDASQHPAVRDSRRDGAAFQGLDWPAERILITQRCPVLNGHKM